MTGATREALIKIYGTLLREGWDELAGDAAAPTTEEGRASSLLFSLFPLRPTWLSRQEELERLRAISQELEQKEDTPDEPKRKRQSLREQWYKRLTGLSRQEELEQLHERFKFLKRWYAFHKQELEQQELEQKENTPDDIEGRG